MDEVMALYQRYDGPYEGLSNTDVGSQALHSTHRTQTHTRHTRNLESSHAASAAR